MCGRYYRKSDKQKIVEAFHATKVDDFPLPPWDYNVAPTTMQPIIRANRDTGERELVQLRWGLGAVLRQITLRVQRLLDHQCAGRDRGQVYHLP